MVYSIVYSVVHYVVYYIVYHVVPCRLRAKLQPLLAKVSKENNADAKLVLDNLLDRAIAPQVETFTGLS